MAKLKSADKKMYDEFARLFDFCFTCGWRPNEGLWRNWMIGRLEMSHIVGGSGRRHDRRAIVRQCSGCHRLFHGDRVRIGGSLMPTLTKSNLLWAKQKFDPDYYDVEYLNSLSIARLAEPKEPAEWFMSELRANGLG